MREDVIMVARDFLPRRFVRVDDRELGPGPMLSDLVPFPQEDEFLIPVILRTVHLGEDERAVQRMTREAELFLEDAVRGRLRRLAEQQVRRRQHPSLAVQRGPVRIEGSDMVPPRGRIEMTHQDAVTMAALAQDEEGGQTDPALRNLAGLQRAVRRGEATELPVCGHV